MRDTDPAHGVVDVVREVGDRYGLGARIRPQEASDRRDVHRAADVAQRVELLVIQIAGMVARARTQECVATTGVREADAACSIAALEACDTSTSIPSAFSAAIASRPSALRPPCSSTGSPRSARGLDKSASALWPLWVSVR